MINVVSRFSAFSYDHIARPLLFKLSSDAAHSLITQAGIASQSVPLLGRIIHTVFAFEDNRLQQEVNGIVFQNPIGLSAGFDKEARLPKLMSAIGFGLEEVGSITANRYDGNPKPWYTRLPHTKSVLVNSGLRSSGVEAIAKRADTMPVKIYNSLPINASIAKTNSPECNTVDKGIVDYITSFKRLEQSPWPRMYTINISCPNTSGGEPFNKPDNLRKLLAQVDALDVQRPIFLKVPIDLDWDDVKPLLDVAASSKIQGITIGNLAKDRNLVDERDKNKLTQNQRGNLSGRPCWNASNKLLAQCYATYGDRFSFIGVGGVFSAEDAYQKMRLGATLVELITGMIFKGPTLIGEINKGLVELMNRDGITHISDIIGVDAKAYIAQGDE